MNKTNDSTLEYLRDFSAKKNAKFAVLVSAPWGSGKTHLIQKLVEELGKSALKVSVFGASSRADIEESLCLALLSQSMPNQAGAIAALGGSLVRLAPRQWADAIGEGTKRLAEANFPDTLIFDDLERTEMSSKELLGCINYFVEQQNKNVILVADDNKLWTEDGAQEYKEKVIGATLPVEADIAAALTSVIEAQEESVRQFLFENRSALEEIFQTANHNNLRSLAQAVWEFSRFFQAIDQGLKENSSAMVELTRVYFALALDLKAGALSEEDLSLRSRFELREKPEFERLEASAAKFGIEEIRRGQYLAVLPVSLGVDLLARGRIDKEQLNKVLAETPQFKKPEMKSEWEKLFGLYQADLGAACSNFKAVERRFDAREFTEPGEVLQVFSALLLCCEYRICEKSVDEMGDECSKYIKDLVSRNTLRARLPSKSIVGEEMAYGYTDRGYGLYGFPVSKTKRCKVFDRLFVEMRTAQDDALKAKFPEVLTELIALLDTDIPGFTRKITSVRREDIAAGTYAFEPIFKCADVGQWAEKIIGLSARDCELVLQSFADRHPHHRPEIASERSWFNSLREEMNAKTRGEHAFRVKQVETQTQNMLGRFRDLGANEE